MPMTPDPTIPAAIAAPTLLAHRTSYDPSGWVRHSLTFDAPVTADDVRTACRALGVYEAPQAYGESIMIHGPRAVYCHYRSTGD